ncbi:MAG TPA: sulfotransferase [Bacillales bacterium]|nr:sulfotransferase [Bacillales bacterium]
MGNHSLFEKPNKKTLSVMAAAAGALGLYKLLKKKDPQSEAIVVLGSGQSGTSVLTRCLKIIGVDLGSSLIKPNPKGNFENKRIRDIQKQMIKTLKHRPFPTGWQHSKRNKTFKKQLTQAVQDEFSGEALWGWKDPRTIDLLAMWKEILDDLNVEGHYLIMVRNPIDVITSYQKNYNREEHWARLQWQIRTLMALKETQGKSRMIVTYDDLFNYPLECMRKIAQRFDLPWTKDEMSLKNKLDTFVHPELTRNSTDIEALANREDIEKDVKDLYLLCLKGAHSRVELQSKEFNAQVDELYHAFLQDHGQVSFRPPKKQS